MISQILIKKYRNINYIKNNKKNKNIKQKNKKNKKNLIFQIIDKMHKIKKDFRR